jgi:hypothetical protein
MKETARRQRNTERLAELYPTFSARVAAVIRDLEAQGERPRIQDAWRSPADQLAAFNAGHSKLKYGFHNVTGPGGRKEGLAVDMLNDNSPMDHGSPYLLKLAAAAERNGLKTGIRWGVPAHLVEGIDRAIAAADWNARVKIGWDPTHVEPVGLTVAQAKSGTRPA